MIAVAEEKGESTTSAPSAPLAPSARLLSTTSGNLALGAATWTDLYYGAFRTDQLTDRQIDVPSYGDVRTLLKRTRTADVRKKTDNGGREVDEGRKD